MSLREAAQAALATLRDCAYDEEGFCINPDAEDAYEALRDALARTFERDLADVTDEPK